MIFKLYTVYNKHEMIKIANQTRDKLQVLSQMLETFAADCTKDNYRMTLPPFAFP